MGFKRFFRCVLKIICQNQDRPKTIRLRNNWVDMDPRGWNSDMDFVVNVGLGSGSQDRDAAILMQIAQKQEQIIQQAGPMNPIAGIDKYANTLRKLTEAVGLRNADQYFGEVGPEQLQQMQQAQGQQQEDPKAQAEMQKAQAQIQLDQQKTQAQLQLDQQKMQFQLQLERERNAMDMQTAREKAQLDMQIAREKAEYDRQRRAEDAMLDAQLRREEMALEAELTREANAMNAAVQSQKAVDDNIERKKVSKKD